MGRAEERILILAPTGRDSELASTALERAGFVCSVCADTSQLIGEVRQGDAGAVLVAIEALAPAPVASLAIALQSQASWSDLPVLVLSFPESHGGPEIEAALRLGNVVLLDRPLRVATLLSAVQSALRARRRQYQLRARVEEIQRRTSELAESEARYRVLTELAPDALLVESDGTVQYANHAAARLLAVDRDELVGAHREDFMVSTAGAESEDAPGEELWRSSDGRRIPVELASSAIRWDGRPARQVLARDISARKKLEEELRAVSKQKDEFLGLVSHELRTPLTVIRGVTDLLRREGGPAQQMTDNEATSLLRESAERLGAVVDNMLSLARLTHESISLEPVLVRVVVMDAIERHRRRCPQRRIEARVEPGIMEANAASVDQVLENLLSNAEKYSPETTTIEVEATSADGEIHIFVRDEGEGLDANEVESYFASFFRSQRREADQKPGAGLGLTVCKLLVEAQGGRIWARQRPTGGAEFGFAVPAIESDADVAIED